MKLKFKDLGKIKEADFELADFTLIVGDNSLGKTILLEAYALYVNVMKDLFGENHIYDVEINEMDVLGEHSEVSFNYKMRDEDSLKVILDGYKEKYLTLLKENILKNAHSNADVEITYNYVNSMEIPNKVKVIYHETLISVNFGARGMIIPRFNDEENGRDLMLQRLKNRITSVLNMIYFEKLCGIEEIVFFPSERNLYRTNAYKKSAEFIEDSFLKIEKDGDMRYSESLFVKSYFKYLDSFDFWGEIGHSEERQALYDLLCRSLGGTPDYEDGMIIAIQQKGENIPQNLFSTKQNRFLPYFMLCNNFIVREQDRIIIEEPEAHMSLKSMFELVEITEYILQDNKMIMTSHSDVFVSLLNNLIKKNQINAKVYELLEEGPYNILKEVVPGDYGYELSFMSEQMIRLNEQTLEVFKDVVERGE
ncbi:ATP-binding protein [Lysinibacillus piscis]|uniref:AAA domain-containing protein n=1 Tax=Lysinibacillus piscis TaxID=2518931 RepID=A0ABQ5NMS4_9BACI|nr:ATP-binding protein [Lysinibacillus sp. KH24]GLC89650.1 hypothetical protein LYSBPC_27770 [Lysinibacillus sp. KH24]